MFSYSYPHFLNEITFLTWKPTRLSYSSSIYRPFDNIVWIILHISLLFTFAICKIIHRFSSKLYLFEFTKIILGQSISNRVNKTTIIRIMLASWIICLFITRLFYCAKLWDLMTFVEYGKYYETIEQIYQAIEHGDIKVIQYHNYMQVNK
jgi:hypothetical protein